jgi:hypothetical protein
MPNNTEKWSGQNPHHEGQGIPVTVHFQRLEISFFFLEKKRRVQAI